MPVGYLPRIVEVGDSDDVLSRSSPLNPTGPEAHMTNHDPFARTDELGPAKIIHITERRTGLRAIVVVDNVAAGPAIGGLRMAPDTTTDICFRLARAMTLKNAMAGLRHGGGKSCIVADPSMPVADKERMIRSFAGAIRTLDDYIPGPDMGTDETAMAWVLDEIGRAVGLPAEIGGLPLDQLGVTGFGVAAAAEVAASRAGIELDGARIAVQGYGNVGRPAARLLAEKGCILVATSDSRGGIADRNGLSPDDLDGLKAASRSVIDHPGERVDRDLVGVECDIWIPAAGPDVVRSDNVDKLQAAVVVQGANIAVTADAEARLHERGVLSIPDFVANAGGVICGAVEYAKGSRTQAFELTGKRIRDNTSATLDRSDESGQSPLDVATVMARERVRAAMALRRWH